MREMFDEALERLGGVVYLVKFGKEKPELFIGMLARMLPWTVESSMQRTKLTVDVLEAFRERARIMKKEQEAKMIDIEVTNVAVWKANIPCDKLGCFLHN